jgi:uncharacterized protein YecE (DUF72 family)
VASETSGNIRIGTSAFIAAAWEGSFYPSGMKPAEFLTYYATRFKTVEVDSTYYRTPSASTVAGWAREPQIAEKELKLRVLSPQQSGGKPG